MQFDIITFMYTKIHRDYNSEMRRVHEKEIPALW